MGIIQPYRGHFVNAESASSKLDIESIFAGCDAVDAEVSNIDNISNEITNSSSYLDARNFSIGGETIFNVSDGCVENISKVKESILNTTSQIRSACEEAYNNLQSQLNYNAQVKDQNEVRKANSRS